MATMQGDGNRNQQGTQQGTTQQGLTQQGRNQQESTQMTRGRQNQMMRPIRRLRALSPFASAFSSLSPFSMVRRMFDDMERMMDSMMSDFDEVMPETMSNVSFDFVPNIDVARRDDKLVVRADLPGLSPDQVKVYATDDGDLVIEGERRIEDERRVGGLWQSERMSGRFFRVIPMPEGIDFNSADARFENGVLEVSLKAPQQIQGRGRQIQINAGKPDGGQRQQLQTPQKTERS